MPVIAAVLHIDDKRRCAMRLIHGLPTRPRFASTGFPLRQLGTQRPRAEMAQAASSARHVVLNRGSVVNSTERYPRWRQVVLETTDTRGLAEFYRELLGYAYRPGDEPPAPGEPDPLGSDWLTLNDPRGGAGIAFQQVDDLPATTWPQKNGVAQQYHLDLDVPTFADLEAQHERVLALGATLRYDRSEDPEEPLRVYADPSGHLFCIFVSGQSSPGSNP